MENLPDINLGLVAVSRDCFPVELSRERRKKVIKECKNKKLLITEVETLVENETDVLNALKEINRKNINALVIYLGNFGPEGPLSMLAQKFDGPVMMVAAAEESGRDLYGGRGDAYCGLLSASYNTGLRNVRCYTPEYPVGMPDEIAGKISDFIPVARVIIGLKKLKIFSFGPRPYDFLTCHAPIKPLFDLGIEIMENSELDLFELYNKAENHPDIPAVLAEMKKELGSGNQMPGILPKLARYEIVLREFMANNLGASAYSAFANKCWPAFQTSFGFVPCYVNSRFAARGIPIACEADIYGALSEYIITCATDFPATLLDINNTVPYDMYEEAKEQVKGYRPHELFMGFHCGNTAACLLNDPAMKYQLIMHRLLEPAKDPDITRGTLEGTIRSGETTLFRFQSTAEGQLKAYVAEGEVLNIDPKTFGGTGVFAIPEMDRFYRHVLLEHKFPHHTGAGFKHAGKTLFTVCKMLGVDVFFNQPKEKLYPSENPFKSITPDKNKRS
jgi:L-fucose isomerase-like protein